MAPNGYLGAWAMRLRRPPPPATDVETSGPAEASFRATHVLSDFVSELRARTAPVVVDLGPAIGANVTFLGDEIGCKLFIEDLLSHMPDPPSDTGANVESGWEPSLPQADESVDGILCWDVVDHLQPSARLALAAQLVRVLRPGGVMLMCHRVDLGAHPERVVHEIVGPGRLCLRRGSEAPAPVEHPLRHRELRLMFGELAVLKTVLLKSRMRELLFQKAGPSAGSV